MCMMLDGRMGRLAITVINIDWGGEWVCGSYGMTQVRSHNNALLEVIEKRRILCHASW